MARRLLFFALTLVLVAALLYLLLRGARQEAETGAPIAESETTEKSESSAIRVLSPQDLEITGSGMVLESQSGTSGPSLAARHEVEIRNRGRLPYGEVQIRIVYRAGNGKVVETRTRKFPETIAPGQSLKPGDFRVEGLPGSAVDAEMSVAYADIATAPEAARPGSD